jgi:hypothetical protein
MGPRRLPLMFPLRLLWCGVRIRGGVLRRLWRLWRRLPISPLLWVGLFGMIGMGRGFWMFWRLCGLRSRRLLVVRGAWWRRCGRPVGARGDGCLGLVLGVRWLLVG